MNSIRFVGIACIVGGVAFFGDLGLHLFSGLGQFYFVFAIGIALCLMGGPIGLRALGVFTPGWRNALSWVGTLITVLGIALWITAFVLLFANPSAAFTQRLTPGGSLLMAIGMLLLGIATLASGRMQGWCRWVPLLVGLYFPLQLAVQLMFFLNGRDGTPGPNGMLLGAWGLLWALLGYALYSLSRKRQVATPALAQ